MNNYQQFLDQYFRENYKRFSVISANQLKRFGIRGDIFDLQSDVTQSVLTKFIKSECNSNCNFLILSMSSGFSSLKGSKVLLFFPAV